MNGTPWDNFGISKRAFWVSEALVDRYAPGPIVAEEITRLYIRMFRSPPRDDDLLDIECQLKNYGLKIRRA